MNTQPQQQPTPPPERHRRTPHQSTEVRLAIVETRWQDVVPTLATKADLNEALGLSKMELKGEITGLRAELKSDIAGLRTEFKSEIAGLRAEFKSDIAGLRAELKGDIADLRTELKGDIAELRTEMHKMDATITRWMLGAIIGLFIGLGTLYFAQQRSMDNAISRLERLYAPVRAVPPLPAPAAMPQQPD